MNTKQCKKCLIEKPADAFYQRRGGKCKLCINQRVREWQQKNKDRLLVYQAKNRERDAIKAGLRRQAHKEYFQLKTREYVEIRKAKREQNAVAGVPLPASRVCVTCSLELPLSKFDGLASGKYGKNSECKKCVRTRNFQPNRVAARHAYNLKKRYGLTILDYDALRANCDYKCSICKTHESDLTRKLAVDHDPKTGTVRALLCTPCNVGIGQLKEDPNVLLAAAEYVHKFRKSTNG